MLWADCWVRSSYTGSSSPIVGETYAEATRCAAAASVVWGSSVLFRGKVDPVSVSARGE